MYVVVTKVSLMYQLTIFAMKSLNLKTDALRLVHRTAGCVGNILAPLLTDWVCCWLSIRKCTGNLVIGGAQGRKTIVT